MAGKFGGGIPSHTSPFKQPVAPHKEIVSTNVANKHEHDNKNKMVSSGGGQSPTAVLKAHSPHLKGNTDKTTGMTEHNVANTGSQAAGGRHGVEHVGTPNSGHASGMAERNYQP